MGDFEGAERWLQAMEASERRAVRQKLSLEEASSCGNRRFGGGGGGGGGWGKRGGWGGGGKKLCLNPEKAGGGS